MNYNIKYSDGNREDLVNYIIKKKSLGTFNVVDVGGSAAGWSAPYIDALIDFNESENPKSNIKHFKCDITHPDSWNEILSYVKLNGKFDFCICTHTLEDIMNPVYVSEQICKISKEGYIAFPSKFIELSKNIEGYYRGYIHHRWIFNVKNNSQIVAYPKISMIENDNRFDMFANSYINRKDLSFYWKDNIDMVYVNNNYLGPNPQAVINYYYNLLIE